MGCSNNKSISVKIYKKNSESNKTINFQNQNKIDSSSNNNYYQILKEENEDKKEENINKSEENFKIIKYKNEDKIEKEEENNKNEIENKNKNEENNKIEIVNNFIFSKNNERKKNFNDSKDEEKFKIQKNVYLNKEIKSNHIMKKIFSFLEENIKLKIIVYNKKLKKLFNINIEHYKNICKSYIIGEINGEGKEYEIYTNKLLYEGEYKNGKRNGGLQNLLANI